MKLTKSLLLGTETGKHCTAIAASAHARLAGPENMTVDYIVGLERSGDHAPMEPLLDEQIKIPFVWFIAVVLVELTLVGGISSLEIHDLTNHIKVLEQQCR